MGVGIPIIFIAPETTPGSYTGALGGPPLIKDWLEQKKSDFIYRLRSSLPHMEIKLYTITTPEEARRVVELERDSVGFVVVLLHTWSGGGARVFIESGKPVVLIAESYGGGGEFLIEFGRGLREGRPVIGVSVREFSDELAVRKVKLLDVLQKLRSSKIVFVMEDKKRFEYIENMLRSVFGITAIHVDGKSFAEKYYRPVDEALAREWAEKWIGGAAEVLEDRFEDIVKAAKLYIAMKRVLEEHSAISIAVDCIRLFDAKILDAWPCLGFMQLWFDGYIPVCEADPYSAVALLIMWYLAKRPGFVSDPVVDYQRDEAIYYHCYAPINPFGGNTRVPYTIMPAHLYLKRASVYVELPINQEITAFQVWPEQRAFIIHRATAIGNERSIHACATKLVAKTNAKAIARNWKWTWHRVVFYGNLAEDLRDLATLLGFTVIEEDEEMP